MARFDISLLGGKELGAALAALPEAVERKVLNAAIKQGTTFVKTIIAARLPRSAKHRRSGAHLADTLKVKAFKRRKGRVGYMVQAGTREELGIPANDPFYFPTVLEFGAKNRPPHPVWRQAMNEAKAGILAAIRIALDTGIEKEMTKVPKPKR